MGDFGDAERRILAFMTEGTEFVFQDKKYKVIFSGNPLVIKESQRQIYTYWRSLNMTRQR